MRFTVFSVIIMVIIFYTVSCEEYEQSSEVSIRHFYVIYRIHDTGTTAYIRVQFRIQDASGDVIQLDSEGGDTINVYGCSSAVEDEDSAGDLEYQISCTSADHYTFEFIKDGSEYIDVVNMPLVLDSITVPPTIYKNTPFNVSWGNYEGDSQIVLYFYQGSRTKSCYIPDNSDGEYYGDNSSWLTEFTAGTVNMEAYRTRTYTINRSFRGGKIIVIGPYTPEASITLSD